MFISGEWKGKQVDRMLDWTDQARCQLQSLRGREGNWGYKRGGRACVEPTVVSSLGLIASGDRASAASDLAGARATAEWMTAIQRPDGSLAVVAEVETPAWTTPYAMLLWNALGGYEEPRMRARGSLLHVQGQSLPRNEDTARVIGHDPTVRGWPWVESTHSWVEPTALATLALCREGLHDHGRVRAGIHLILNRSLQSGGWNYGNPAVLGRALRAQPGPSGLALLALKAHGEDTPECRRGIDYLRQALRDVRAGISLGWGILGLRAWDACPPEAGTWIAESYGRYGARPDAVVGLALLLMAASERGLELLIKPKEGDPGPRAGGRAASHATRVSS
jgi:hypothetical protein